MSEFKRLDELLKQNHERQLWNMQLSTDAELKKGVEAEMPFEAFQARTQCPDSLQARYQELERQYAADKERAKDPFKEAFLSSQY